MSSSLTFSVRRSGTVPAPPMPRNAGVTKSSSKGKKATSKKTKTKGSNNYRSFLYKVLKQIHPDTGISAKSMDVLNSLVSDVFERLASESGKLARASKRRTLTAREIQTAARLVLPGELAKHAIAEGTRALTKYSATKKL